MGTVYTEHVHVQGTHSKTVRAPRLGWRTVILYEQGVQCNRCAVRTVRLYVGCQGLIVEVWISVDGYPVTGL